jgi:hypothetical protein
MAAEAHGWASMIFGLAVNANDLLRAANAFSSYRKQSKRLLLMIARKRGGVPVSKRDEGRIGLADLPYDVLEIIREELFALVLEMEPDPFVRAHKELLELHETRAQFSDKQMAKWAAWGPYGQDLLSSWRTWPDEVWKLHRDSCDECLKERDGPHWNEKQAVIPSP